MIVAVDDDGCFTGKITDFSGRYVKDADKDIIEAMKVKLMQTFIYLFILFGQLLIEVINSRRQRGNLLSICDELEIIVYYHFVSSCIMLISP